MQLDYRLTTDDYIAFGTHVARTSPAFTGVAARQRAVVTVLIALAFLGAWGLVLDDWAFAAVAGVLGGLVPWFLLPVLTRREYEKNLRRISASGDGLGATGAARLSVDDEGLSEVVAGTTMSVTWAGVERVEETDRHLFVFVGPHAALVVPLSAPGARELAEHVRRRVETARELPR